MPLKRVPKAQRETPAARRLREEIIAELNADLIALGAEPAGPDPERQTRIEARMAAGATEIEAELAELDAELIADGHRGLFDPPQSPVPHRPPPATQPSKPSVPRTEVSGTAKPMTAPKRKPRPIGHVGYAFLDGEES